MTHELVSISLNVILQGLIYSLVVLHVFLSSRIIGFDDLTTEGSFGLGGALTALCIVSHISPWLSLPLSMAGGALAGASTGLLHTKMKMNNLISGLVITTALFSICLKLAKANLTLPEGSSIFASLNLDGPLGGITLLLLILIVIFVTTHLLLRSEVGLILKAIGCNSHVVTNIGKDVEKYKLAGLAIANSMTALAGSLFVQWNGYFSITGNVGTLVIGLAGLILSEMIELGMGLGLVVGSIFYQAIFAVTIELQLDPMWNNLIKAVLIVLLMQMKSKKTAPVTR